MPLIERIEARFIRDKTPEGLIYNEEISNRALQLALHIARKIDYSESGVISFCDDKIFNTSKTLDKIDKSSANNFKRECEFRSQPTNYQKMEISEWGIDGTYFPPEELN